jgi:hypothetical protein
VKVEKYLPNISVLTAPGWRETDLMLGYFLANERVKRMLASLD